MSDPSIPRWVAQIRASLDRFDLEVAFTTDSPAIGVFGPSGAGKTTLLEAIAGLARQVEGQITFEGTPWLDTGRRLNVPAAQRGVGYVPQDGLLFPHLDVRGNLLAGADRAAQRGLTVSELLETVCTLLELQGLLDSSVDRLSGGERQRVALGRALMSGPRLLLLDEPLAGLDLALRRRILPLLVRVRERLGVPMLFVSHEPTEVQALCEEVVVLDRGRLVAHGATHDVLTDPKVFPLAAAHGYQTVVEATVARADGDGNGGVEIGTDSLRVATPRPVSPPGSRLWIGIPAADVILARGLPDRLSARNRLAAEVVSVDAINEQIVVRASIAPGVPPIAALLTPSARDELAITPGERVVLIFKANACVLYE